MNTDGQRVSFFLRRIAAATLGAVLIAAANDEAFPRSDSPLRRK